MLQGWVVVIVALGYIGLLFVVASYGDRMRKLGRDDGALPRETCLHRPQMRRFADRHLAAAAHLRERDAECVFDGRGIGIEIVDICSS